MEEEKKYGIHMEWKDLIPLRYCSMTVTRTHVKQAVVLTSNKIIKQVTKRRTVSYNMLSYSKYRKHSGYDHIEDNWYAMASAAHKFITRCFQLELSKFKKNGNLRRKVNLEKCDESANHFHADQWQPIPAKVDFGTYPRPRRPQRKQHKTRCS